MSIYVNIRLYIYPTKKKRNRKIFQLSSPFNVKMLVVIKYLFLVGNLTKFLVRCRCVYVPTMCMNIHAVGNHF